MKKIFQYMLGLAAMFSVTACQEDDDFTDSIFDTNIAAVDPNSSTAPFDQWLYDNFVKPYNTEIQYKFNFTASDLNYQLSPSDYKKSQMLAHFIKYLFYDVYNKYGEKDAHGNEVFMKKYGPRIFHFIGSDAFSPTTGTQTLGYASAGVKITLIGVNNMKTVTEGMNFTADDMNALNKDQFHTMHHEFSHIMHQTKVFPTQYSLVTPGDYDPRTWQERDSTESHRLGFVTQYGSSSSTEDFVETLSCTITDTDHRWMTTLIDACLNGGVKNGDKEAVYTLIDSLEIANVQDPVLSTFDDPKHYWNNFSIYSESAQNEETGVYEPTGRYVIDAHLDDAKVHAKTPLKFEYVQSFTSFRDFLDNWVQIDVTDNTGGINAILKKIEIATKWYTENWGLHLYTMRREVRYRQDHVNDYVHSDECIIYDYQ